MWYKIDFTKLAVYLLPSLLRSLFLVALIKVMIAPLRYIYTRFCELKESTDDRLNITGNVQYLEKTLNDAFCLTDRQIHIETPGEDIYRSVLYLRSEKQPPVYIRTLSEGGGLILRRDGETGSTVNFIVWVPTFLCTSTESKEQDKYGWENYRKILNLLGYYKPAGRMFDIELYDYE